MTSFWLGMEVFPEEELKYQLLDYYKSPIRKRVQYIFSRALRLGTLCRPEACSICGTKAKHIDGHHTDYTEPLKVIWVCRLCHRKIHQGIMEGVL
jgi:hypothetical protein